MTAVFNAPAFKTQFPEFLTWANSQIATYWTMASELMDPNDGPILSGATLQLGVDLMAAHIAKGISNAGSGTTGGVVTGGTEGSAGVTFAPPPFKNGWQYWLSTTPYGQQLWAMLQMRSAGGLHVGGSLERASFRGAGGTFGGGCW